MGGGGGGGGEGGREGGKGVGEGGREGGKVRSLAGSSNTVISGEEREEGRKPLFTGGKMKIKKDRENVTISQVGGQGGGGQRENRQWEEVKEMSGRRQGRSWRGTKREEKGNRKKDGRGEGGRKEGREGGREGFTHRQSLHGPALPVLRHVLVHCWRFLPSLPHAFFIFLLPTVLLDS